MTQTDTHMPLGIAKAARLLLVDDHPIVRAGLKQLLETSGRAFEVGEAGSGREALDQTRQFMWDAVILDVSLPDKNGLLVLKQLRQEHPSLPILMMSVHPEDQIGVRALRAGASGYITKTSDPATLLEAVKRVLSGRRYVGATLAEKLADEIAGGRSSVPHEALTDREFEIFRMIAAGERPAAIAAELCLSPKTVQTYRARVLEKMGMKSNAELIQYAYAHQLLQ